ncbi:hypothetical protein [Flammeovirga sp. SubArs3]|uniref:hypothetical protein n=1 Tax=Flammeovirga sp. SubArs3 TaxID=2995316 RepID=UPI00248C4C1D|nr:hypothetical protein [Flammeovirga sp. SubArs3]
MSTSTQAQTPQIEKIKAAQHVYMWGEGTGITTDEADQQALRTLISQISLSVESQFSTQSCYGTGSELKENVSSVVNTYSSATLNNAERIVFGEEPDAKVFRYIKREDVAKVFTNRYNKIKEFAHFGDKYLEELKIADAVRYYYWGMILTRSHPDANELTYKSEIDYQERNLMTYFPKQLDDIFEDIDFKTKEIELEEDHKIVHLGVYYKDQEVQNLDYTYWDGRDWSSIVSAKDGRGILEFMGPMAESKENSKIKIEYMCKKEAKMDREVEDVLSKVKGIPFKSAYQPIEFNKKQKVEVAKKLVSPTTTTTKDLKFSDVVVSEDYQNIVEKAIKLSQNHDFTSLAEICTPQGKDFLERLFSYGSVSILPSDDVTTFKVGDVTEVRAVPMSFSFRNNRKFIEDVVFGFDVNGKIDHVNFALSKIAYEDILSKKNWPKEEKQLIIHFMEQYKTAYALKRLDYISSIFSDDALIIVGNIVKKSNGPESRFGDHTVVKYNKQTKAEYIGKLKYQFQRKEFINLKFEDSTIKKAGYDKPIYGIQIKQHYFSNNYGDKGYLFLMVDLTSIKEPMIHVRTWQPEKNADGEVFGLADF